MFPFYQRDNSFGIPFLAFYLTPMGRGDEMAEHATITKKIRFKKPVVISTRLAVNFASQQRMEVYDRVICSYSCIQ